MKNYFPVIQKDKELSRKVISTVISQEKQLCWCTSISVNIVLHIYGFLHLSAASVQIDFSLIGPLRTHG